MKGIVFNLFEEVIRRQHGEDTWDHILATSQLDGIYTSLGNYRDDELSRLVGAASGMLDRSPAEVTRWFGQNALPLMAERYPMFFRGHDSTRSFVLTLNSIIHPEVRKGYQGYEVPVFDFDIADARHLTIGYQSARRLCTFAQGLIEGAGRYFHEDVLFEHLRCMHRGDEKCVFRVAFVSKMRMA